MPLLRRLPWLALLVVAACDDPPPPWDKGLPATSVSFPARRGLQVARGAIHLHSPYSHDACDGKGLTDGVPDSTCLEHLRSALCTTHYDYAMLTDHADFLSATAWDELFLPMLGTEPVVEGGKHVASWLPCADGTRTLLTVGSENELMPLGLEEHVAATPDERRTLLQSADPVAAAAFREHGALIALAHGESKTDAQIAAVEADALEIYNLHANLGPDIRAAMGLDATAPLVALLPLITDPDPKFEPDLTMLLFWEENAWELDRLEARWSSGARAIATAGADAHENTLSLPMADGERGDSYRRILRWFSNHLLVDELSPRGLKDAIEKGRAYAAFEIFGPPTGLDFRAESAGAVAEIGDEISVGAALVLEPPSSPELAPEDVVLRILRVADGASTELASGPGTVPLQVRADAAGAYRAEVRVTPRRLGRFMSTSADKASQSFVWIYTSPIYVR